MSSMTAAASARKGNTPAKKTAPGALPIPKRPMPQKKKDDVGEKTKIPLNNSSSELSIDPLDMDESNPGDYSVDLNDTSMPLSVASGSDVDTVTTDSMASFGGDSFVSGRSGISRNPNDDSEQTEEEEGDEDQSATPGEADVCFDAEDHPGTDDFLMVLRIVLKKFGPDEYSPVVFRRVKKYLTGRKFFVRDDDGPKEWRQTTKSELIDIVWKHYDEAKKEFE